MQTPSPSALEVGVFKPHPIPASPNLLLLLKYVSYIPGWLRANGSPALAPHTEGSPLDKRPHIVGSPLDSVIKSQRLITPWAVLRIEDRDSLGQKLRNEPYPGRLHFWLRQQTPKGRHWCIPRALQYFPGAWWCGSVFSSSILLPCDTTFTFLKKILIASKIYRLE